MALNFQTPCTEIDLNQGRFLQNGQSGYILKPSYLRERATEFDPITLTRGPWLTQKILHVMASGLKMLLICYKHITHQPYVRKLFTRRFALYTDVTC